MTAWYTDLHAVIDCTISQKMNSKIKSFLQKYDARCYKDVSSLCAFLIRWFECRLDFQTRNTHKIFKIDENTLIQWGSPELVQIVDVPWIFRGCQVFFSLHLRLERTCTLLTSNVLISSYKLPIDGMTFPFLSTFSYSEGSI